jgi:hypothetical protein
VKGRSRFLCSSRGTSERYDEKHFSRPLASGSKEVSGPGVSAEPTFATGDLCVCDANAYDVPFDGSPFDS